MPAFATHYYYANQVFNNLERDIQELIKEYRDFYNLGAQGPDIFFYYKPYQKNYVIKFGNNLHDKPARTFFESALKKIKEKDDRAALVYLIGVSTHFSLDSHYHPIINKVTNNFNEHMILETEFDRKIIKKYENNIQPDRFKRNQLINYQYNKYAQHLNQVYPELSLDILDSTIKQTNFYVKMLRSPLGIFAKILSISSKKFAKGIDYSNLIILKKPNTYYDEIINDLLNSYDEVVLLGINNILSILANYEKNKKLNSHFDKNFE